MAGCLCVHVCIVCMYRCVLVELSTYKSAKGVYIMVYDLIFPYSTSANWWKSVSSGSLTQTQALYAPIWLSSGWHHMFPVIWAESCSLNQPHAVALVLCCCKAFSLSMSPYTAISHGDFFIWLTTTSYDLPTIPWGTWELLGHAVRW